jgi:hypothetical protein
MAGIMNSMKRNRTTSIMRKARQKPSGGGGFNMRLSFGKTPVGKTSAGVWVHFHEQAWSSYYRDAQRNLQENVGAPWHNEVSHYAPEAGYRGMGFTCSAGHNVDKPCYGHAEHVRVRMETDEQAMDLIDKLGDNDKTQAMITTLHKGAKEIRRISTSSKCVFSVLVLEEVLEVPKQGSRFTRNVLKPLASSKEVSDASGVHLYEKATYSTSSAGRDQLLILDSQIRTTCASCNQGLQVIGWVCDSCDAVHELDHSKFMAGEDEFNTDGFESFLRTAQSCRTCGTRCIHEEYCDDDDDTYSIVYHCDCEAPVQGSMLNLALKIAERKITDTSKEIVILETACLPEIAEKSMFDPLDLNHLKKGDSVESQKKRLGAIVEDLDPTIVTVPNNSSEAEAPEQDYSE